MIEVSENIASYIKSVFGDQFFQSYKDFIESEYIPYIRINSLEDEEAKLIEALKKYNIELKPVTNVSRAYSVLSGSTVIGKTLEFAMGKYYIQSLSSMIPPLILNPVNSDITLDMCAAPGSKATQLALMMKNSGILYVNEPNLNRTKSLAHNLDKMNIVNAGMMVSKGEWLSKHFDEYFDKILVDAPCTGLGIVQKKQEVSNWWNTNHALRLSETQTKLLVSAIKSVKIGGDIVYSTCTMTLEENEFLINRVLKKYPVELMEIELPVKSHPGFTKYGEEKLDPELEKTKRIIPWEINSEGFFIAKLKKVGKTQAPLKTEIKRPQIFLLDWNHKLIRNQIEEASTWFGVTLEVFSQFRYLVKKNEIQFINKEWNTENLNFFNRIGLKLGKVDKNGLLVLHTLAIQFFQKRITKNIIELSEEKDLNTYLSGGTIKSMTFIEPKGRKAIKYKENLIGTAIATKDGLKSQFPRALRTAEIIF